MGMDEQMGVFGSREKVAQPLRQAAHQLLPQTAPPLCGLHTDGQHSPRNAWAVVRGEFRQGCCFSPASPVGSPARTDSAPRLCHRQVFGDVTRMKPSWQAMGA